MKVKSGRVCIQLILLSCLVLMGGVILDLNTNRPHFPRPRKLMVFFVKYRWGRPPKWEFPLGRKNKNGVTPHKKKTFHGGDPPLGEGYRGVAPHKKYEFGDAPKLARRLGGVVEWPKSAFSLLSWWPRSGPRQHSLL